MNEQLWLASQNNTSATGAYFCYLSFFLIANTATYQLVLYTCKKENVCSSSLTQKTKTHRTPKRIKTPLVHPASSSQKNNHPKILDNATSKSIMESGKKGETEKKKTTNLCAQLQEKYHIKTSVGFKNDSF